MKLNLGNTDYWTRNILGLAIGAAGLYVKSWFGLIAIAPLGTVLMGRSPRYTVLRISTCPAQPEGSST